MYVAVSRSAERSREGPHMKKSEKIVVVGVDGSKTASKAAMRAAQIAAESGSKLVVLTAFTKDKTDRIEIGDKAWSVTAEDEAEATADLVSRTLKPITSNIEITAMRGKPAKALVAEAKRLNASLIVVGNRRVQGPSRVFGSIAQTVSRTAPCDVCIVKTV